MTSEDVLESPEDLLRLLHRTCLDHGLSPMNEAEKIEAYLSNPTNHHGVYQTLAYTWSDGCHGNHSFDDVQGGSDLHALAKASDGNMCSTLTLRCLSIASNFVINYCTRTEAGETGKGQSSNKGKWLRLVISIGLQRDMFQQKVKLHILDKIFYPQGYFHVTPTLEGLDAASLENILSMITLHSICQLL